MRRISWRIAFKRKTQPNFWKQSIWKTTKLNSRVTQPFSSLWCSRDGAQNVFSPTPSVSVRFRGLQNLIIAIQSRRMFTLNQFQSLESIERKLMQIEVKVLSQRTISQPMSCQSSVHMNGNNNQSEFISFESKISEDMKVCEQRRSLCGIVRVTLGLTSLVVEPDFHILQYEAKIRGLSAKNWI